MLTTCDKVGLIWAIVVKVCAYDIDGFHSKWKEMWKTVQMKAGITQSHQLILDMKVQWSSTYLMLDHVEHKKEVC